MRDRTTYIGGTDVSAIFGKNKWKTAFTVWREKIGEGEETPDNPSMEWGRRSEQMIAEKFCEDHDLLIDMTKPQDLVHPQFQFIGGTVDRWLVDSTGKTFGLEIKTAHSRTDWTDNEVPLHYWMQCQWYCGIAKALGYDVDGWYLAVLFDGRDYVEYWIPFDDIWFDGAVRDIATWWVAHVINKDPVDVDGSDAAKAYQTERFAVTEKQAILPSSMISAADRTLLAEYLTMKRNMELQETTLDILETQIMGIIGTNKGVALDNGATVTWVRSKPTESVKWKDVAKAAQVPDDIIKQHTTVGAGRSYLKVAGLEQE